MKQALHRGGWGTFNICATTAGPFLGWAYLPRLPESQHYYNQFTPGQVACRTRGCFCA